MRKKQQITQLSWTNILSSLVRESAGTPSLPRLDEFEISDGS